VQLGQGAGDGSGQHLLVAQDLVGISVGREGEASSQTSILLFLATNQDSKALLSMGDMPVEGSQEILVGRAQGRGRGEVGGLEERDELTVRVEEGEQMAV
jgi:hypothetical protein